MTMKMFEMGIVPFLKWRGGKRKLAPQIVKRFPSDFGDYYEPFLGGGAVFLNSHYMFKKNVFLSDINEHLINCWQQVYRNGDDVIDVLKKLSEDHSEDHFYYVRNSFIHDVDTETAPEIYRAAAFIYLNKTTFNGLWRTNLSGGLNMSFGKGQHKPGNPLVDENVIKEIARVCSSRVQLSARCYSDIPTPDAGSLIYCDPPYDDTNVMYHKNRFDSDEQRNLRNKISEWTNAGVYVMVSNMNTEYIRDLYKAYRILDVMATHVISGRASGRRKVKEVLITNY